MQWAAEQVSLLSQLDSSWLREDHAVSDSHLRELTAQDLLRIIDVAFLLTMLTTMMTVIKHPSVVLFVVHRFERRQLPILQRLSFQRGMRRKRDRESIELSQRNTSSCSVAHAPSVFGAAPAAAVPETVPEEAPVDAAFGAGAHDDAVAPSKQLTDGSSDRVTDERETSDETPAREWRASPPLPSPMAARLRLEIQRDAASRSCQSLLGTAPSAPSAPSALEKTHGSMGIAVTPIQARSPTALAPLEPSGGSSEARAAASAGGQLEGRSGSGSGWSSAGSKRVSEARLRGSMPVSAAANTSTTAPSETQSPESTPRAMRVESV